MSSSEYVHFKDDGTIEFRFDKTSITLRRPAFGEYRSLQEEIDALDADHDRYRVELLGDQGPSFADKQNPTPEEVAARGKWRLERDAETARHNREFRQNVLAWIEKATGILQKSARAVEWPDTDNLPVWLVENAEVYANRMLKHWRTVPLAPGEKAPPTA